MEVHWLKGWKVGWFCFMIGDNQAYVNSEQREPVKEEDSKSGDFSTPLALDRTRIWGKKTCGHIGLAQERGSYARVQERKAK